TMNPLDARFVLHGHLEEPQEIAYLEGSLRNMDLTSPWKELKESAAQLLQSRGFHGFITFETIVDPSGQGQTSIKHSQLIPLSREKQNLDSCLDELLRISNRIAWPSSTSSTKLIYALGSYVP